MSWTAHLHRLLVDCRGATAIEFALLAPAFIIMLLGVLQVGIALQNYNALRSVSADVARYAMVQYADGTELTNTDIEDFAEDQGPGAPYLLNGLQATVTTVAVPRVAGAKEVTLRVTYTIPSLLSSMGLNGPSINFERPIFLPDNA